MTKIAIVIGIFVLIVGVVFAISQFIKNSEPEPIACTLEARLCPDGSYVGRTGPNCEFAECPNPGAIKASGTIIGKVNIGPLCPVEPCPVPKPDPYSSRKVVLTPTIGKSINLDLDSSGNFSGAIPAGTYELTITNCEFLGCRYSLPKTVLIEANQTTRIDVEIDTGIR